MFKHFWLSLTLKFEFKTLGLLDANSENNLSFHQVGNHHNKMTPFYRWTPFVYGGKKNTVA